MPALEPPKLDTKNSPRYCKYCGSLVDRASGKCTGCGNRAAPPRLTTVHKLATACIILVVGMGLLVGLYINAQNKIAELSADCEHCYGVNQRHVESLYELSDELQKVKIDLYGTSANLEWYERNIALVATTGEKYHKHGCRHIKDKPIYIYTVKNAKSKGYEPCPDCYSEFM